MLNQQSCQNVYKIENEKKPDIDNWNKYLEESKVSFLKKCGECVKNNVAIEDFDLLQTLSIGRYCHVILGRRRVDDKLYSIKAVNKIRIVELKAVKSAYYNKIIQSSIDFPFCNTLKYFFQDNCYIYMCESFQNVGNLSEHIERFENFDEDGVVFVAAQCLLALEYLHGLGLLHRSIRAENIMLTDKGYVKLSGFDFCKCLKGRTYTICCPPEYIAPEMLLNVGYGRSVDWWTFGILLYEMKAGTTPFVRRNDKEIMESILKCEYGVPDYFSDDLRSIVSNLIVKDLSQRYGTLIKGIGDVKSHSFFKNISWIALINQSTKSPFVPRVQGSYDIIHCQSVSAKLLDTSDEPIHEKYFKDF